MEFGAVFHKVLLHICTMFHKLQQKWKVNGLNLLLILFTFALGGSLCGILARKIMGFTNLEKGASWVALYIVIMTLIWPLCVLFVSIFLGQFTFFKKYISKIFMRFSGSKQPAVQNASSGSTYRLAIFASGAGSNAAQIIKHFKNNPHVSIELVVCNKPGAGVLNIAQQWGIETLIIEKERFFKGDGYVPELQLRQVTHIILAGFLWKVPVTLLQQWPDAIVNIHPALLPKYGGKGMYGAYVHAAVIANSEKESGITIHCVDEVYDNGDILLQVRCPVEQNDTPETLAARIHQLEHEHYPVAIEHFLKAKKALNKNMAPQS